MRVHGIVLVVQKPRDIAMGQTSQCSLQVACASESVRLHWQHKRAVNAMLLVLAGCTHFIIGRDMAGSKSSVSGEDFYGAYDAQETAAKHAEELHMQTVLSLIISYNEVGYPSVFFY